MTGVRINQAKFKWYLNGDEWDGNWIKINSNQPPKVDLEKSKKKFNTETKSESLDGWRNYVHPVYAVAGANDTGGWEDSPCPSDVSVGELDTIESILRFKKIPTKQMTLESSNVFMVRHFIIVPPYYVDNAREIVSEFLKNTDTRLLYLVK